MKTAKRYTIVECHNDDEVWFKMKEVACGEYVLYSDYKELEQENEINLNRIEVLLDDLKLFQKENILNMQKVRKLEQELTKLKESQTQKSIIKLCNRVDKAEADKAELVEFVRDIAYNDISIDDLNIDWVQLDAWALLNKHTEAGK